MAKKARGRNPRSIPEGKTQINFNITQENFDKVKIIAAQEGVNNSDLFNIALEKFIELYEAKNGKIKLKPKGKGLQEL